jgi:hypothetical protein
VVCESRGKVSARRGSKRLRPRQAGGSVGHGNGMDVMLLVCISVGHGNGIDVMLLVCIPHSISMVCWENNAGILAHDGMGWSRQIFHGKARGTPLLNIM